MSWQPVSAAPMTQIRSGREVRLAHVLVGQAELGPGDRQSPGPAADGDDHPVRSPRAAVGRGDGVGVDEPGVAGLLDKVDPDGADVVSDALAFIEVAGHPLGVGQGSGDVDLGPWPAQAERFPRAPVPHQACGPSQRAHRCRAAVESGAADPPPLDERDLCAQFGGVQGGRNTSRAASNDDNAHLACSSRTDAVMSTTTLPRRRSPSSETTEYLIITLGAPRDKCKQRRGTPGQPGRPSRNRRVTSVSNALEAEQTTEQRTECRVVDYPLPRLDCRSRRRRWRVCRAASG